MGFKRSGVQVPSPIPTKNLYPCDIGFFVYTQSLNKGLERVGIVDSMQNNGQVTVQCCVAQKYLVVGCYRQIGFIEVGDKKNTMPSH